MAAVKVENPATLPAQSLRRANTRNPCKAGLVERTRSEYRLTIDREVLSLLEGCVPIDDSQRHGLAELMLKAYRDTIDDEGETISEALEAIDFYLDRCIRPHSWVLVDDAGPIAMSLVVLVYGLHYIDPVAVAASYKQQGIGTRIVHRSLLSMAEAGIVDVGATITDGNIASERLFAALGARRVGPWPPG